MHHHYSFGIRISTLQVTSQGLGQVYRGIGYCPHEVGGMAILLCLEGDLWTTHVIEPPFPIHGRLGTMT